MKEKIEIMIEIEAEIEITGSLTLGKWKYKNLYTVDNSHIHLFQYISKLLCIHCRSISGGGGMGSGGMSRFGKQTYGLSPQFLDSLGIDGSLHNRLFVANLAYSVDEKKLREVFRLAGRVVTAELNRDKVINDSDSFYFP